MPSYPVRSAPNTSVPNTRLALGGVLLLSLVATSGCAWFRKTDELYAQSPESRPLEVPPDLDRPNSSASLNSPGVASAAATAATARPAAATAVGFTTTGTRDQVYSKVEAALAEIEGVQIASRAIGLGVFDVNYQDSNFLVRVAEVGPSVYVSAVDPRGLPAAGEAPTRLIMALRGAIAGK
ncbi:MAG: hypothetical protein M3Q11_08875 [Pseudomonadota bacterium]|nr:hypothetical protein [Pseudomonadota bacterium]